MFHKKFMITAAAAIFITAVSGPTFAGHPHPGPKQRPNHGPNYHAGPGQKSRVNTKWENRADKNNNGRVDKVEAHKYDKNHPHDGKMDPNGPKHKNDQAHSGPIDTPREEKLDANNDGKIDDVERKHAKAKVNTPREDKLDTDNDGQVEKDEVGVEVDGGNY
jgi:hypothetical protein